jgi:hypothetical protein
MECFSNTLCLENRTSSLPPSELQAAADKVEAQGEHADATAVQVVEENEAALQDAAEEEHLPQTSPEDDESVAEEAEAPAGEEEEPAQRPVGIVSEAPMEDVATYAGRKAAALARIAALQGQVVVAGTAQSQQLKWKVIPESVPLLENESDVAPRLKDISEFTRVHAKVMLANLFIKLTFKVSPHLDFFKV